MIPKDTNTYISTNISKRKWRQR